MSCGKKVQNIILRVQNPRTQRIVDVSRPWALGRREVLSMETYLRDCIEAGRRAGDDPNSRSRQLVNHPSFTLLDRSWKPVAMAIVQKEEPRNPEEEVQVLSLIHI